MDAHKAILMQKQVRNNAEDLQKEFLDMAAWEEQMKKKDLEIRNAKDDRVLPPVRCRKKKKTRAETEETEDTVHGSQEEKPSKAKRISSYDYSSWDKFDVDKACDEVEKDDQQSQKEEKISEIPSKEQLETEHDEANMFKEEGNVLVQKKEYARAVGKYSQAIKIFPGDATYYANRALCQLKIDNLHSAISDCTEAIKLDELYLKAYLRRATARIELRHFEDAKKDIEVILKMEPTNKEAMKMKTTIQNKIKKESNQALNEYNKNAGKSVIEEEIAKRMFGENSNQKVTKDSKAKIVELDCNQPSSSKSTNEVLKPRDSKLKVDIGNEEENKEVIEFEHKKSNKDNRVGVIVESVEKTKQEKLPPWLPKLKEGVEVIVPLTEPPTKTRQKMKRIPVTELPKNESIFKNVEDNQNNVPDIIEPVVLNNRVEQILEASENTVRSQVATANLDERLPPPPKTSVAFLIVWKENTSVDFRYAYLKLLKPKELPDIFKDSMESNIFSEILSILNSKFLSNGDCVYEFLYYLGKLKRFRTLVLFMTQSDKEALQNLFKNCKVREKRTEEEVKNLYTTYEL